MPDISEDLLRLADALVFASGEPATRNMLTPLLPSGLDPYQVFQALQEYCAGRGVILVQHGGAEVPHRAGLDRATAVRPDPAPPAAPGGDGGAGGCGAASAGDPP